MDEPFRDIYPSMHTGAPLRAHDQKDWRGIKGDESRRKRCRHCGFPCDPDRDTRQKEGSWAGKGISYGSQQEGTYVVGGKADGVGGGKSITEYYYQPTFSGGCPNCGSFIWDT